MDLAINLGCDYLKEVEVGANARYRSHAIIGGFLKVLATVIEEEQLYCLTKSKLYSLLTDESTDIAVKKQLVLVARYLVGGVVTTAFINIRDIPDGIADIIVQAILSYLSFKSVDIHKLRGFASDGANVMVGRHNGVAAQLKNSSPSLISIHCVNHRLALAASIEAILDDLRIKEAKDVRWLSHDAAIASMLRILPSLIVSLDREDSERGEPIESGLLRFVKTYNFVATAHLLHKVLPHISRLSLIFQKMLILHC